MARGGIPEYEIGQHAAAKLSGFIQNKSTKCLGYLRQRWLTRLDQFTRKVVGVDDMEATLPQQIRASGFAHPDSAGQAECLHDPKLPDCGNSTKQSCVRQGI